METLSNHQNIIDELYAKYQLKGFVLSGEILALATTYRLSLKETEHITGILLGLGVIFADDSAEDADDTDRTRTDYSEIFEEVLAISPNLSTLIDYIQNIRPPQYREWHILIPQAQSGNLYARDRLIDMYLRVVVKLALNSNKNDDGELDDLIQEGVLGLIRAIRRYNGGKHGSFVSYMPWWVMQHMSRAIADKSRLIRIPVHMVEFIENIEKKFDGLRLSLDHEPSIAEIASHIAIAEDKVIEVQRYSQVPISLDELVMEDEDGFVWFDIPDKDSLSPEEMVSKEFLREVIEEVLRSLKKRERDIIRARYGLDDGREKTLEEVGGMYGVTRERIRQIESRAMRKLQHPSRRIRFEGY